MAHIAANRAGISLHRNCRQPHSGKGFQVGYKHLVIGDPRFVSVKVKRIGILHQKLTPAHDAKAGAHLIPEFPLDMIHVQRQRLVTAHMRTKDIGDLLLIRRPIQHVAVMPVTDPQHFRPIIIIPTGFLPQFGWLNCRHQDFQRPRPVLFLTDNFLDLVQHLLAKRQPRINAGA